MGSIRVDDACTARIMKTKLTQAGIDTLMEGLKREKQIYNEAFIEPYRHKFIENTPELCLL
jgi:hypothetical protein